MQEMMVLRCLRMNPFWSWNRNLGFTPPQQTFSHRKTCERFFATTVEGNNTWEEVAQSDQQQRLPQVVLVSPQIPVNSGNIARTCAATCVGLHLVEDMELNNGGMLVDLILSHIWTVFSICNLVYPLKEGKYQVGDWLVFGSEVDGLPAAAREQCSGGQYARGTVRLPINETYVRSLNLLCPLELGFMKLSAKSNLTSCTAAWMSLLANLWRLSTTMISLSW